MHQSSMLQCAKFVTDYLVNEETLSIADIGSLDVNGSYRPFFEKTGWTYTGIDLALGRNVDIVVPELNWNLCSPVDTGSKPLQFDVVISGQCLEHVRKPWLWIKDVAAILKPNGLLFLTAPNTWGFHEYPIDCWRIWPDGMRALADEVGLKEIKCYIYENDTVGIFRNPLHPRKTT